MPPLLIEKMGDLGDGAGEYPVNAVPGALIGDGDGRGDGTKVGDGNCGFAAMVVTFHKKHSPVP